MGKRSPRTADRQQRLTNQVMQRETADAQQRQARNRIEARSPNQLIYMRSIMENDITFGFGSAGTGKTYLATAMACQYLSEGAVERIVVCRPAQEAGGEKLGYLPGDIGEKMDPYLRAVYDTMHEFWRPAVVKSMIAQGRIEISPLGYMRGRTFHDSFIIADEMQNGTPDALLMLVTRLGEGSKMVITGDPAQRDLKGAIGFERARDRLSAIKGIGFVQFSDDDVVRHHLVASILRAW